MIQQMMEDKKLSEFMERRLLEPVAVKEKLLATWMETDPVPGFVAYGNKYWLTAEMDGIQLYTTPKRTMARPAPFSPHVEVDGVGCIFIGPDGSWRWSFDGEPNGQGVAFEFEGFAKNHGLADASWVADGLTTRPGI